MGKIETLQEKFSITHTVVKKNKQLMSDIFNGNKYDVGPVRRSIKALYKHIKQAQYIIHNGYMDETLAQHSGCVAELALIYAIGNKWSKEDAINFSLKAALHDIGKLKLDPDVLEGADELTERERELINKHPKYGYELLKEAGFSDEYAQVAYQHHEHPSGSGYPRGLKAEQIRKDALIVEVIDVFDAIGSDRVYKDAIMPHKVVKIMKKQFDSHERTKAIRKKLLLALEKQHYGLLVQLSDGSIGLVHYDESLAYEIGSKRSLVRNICKKDGVINKNAKKLKLTKDERKARLRDGVTIEGLASPAEIATALPNAFF